MDAGPRCAELKGHEERRGPSRPKGVQHGVQPDRQTWLEERRREAEELGVSRQPEVLIVGGGQCGIALAARLRQLDVPTIVADRHAMRPGDQAARALQVPVFPLHDPVWYDHLPYVKFPDNWPVFSPKDKIADWLEMYTRVMELNYWGSTTATAARYDDDAGEWDVTLERDGEAITVRPKQLVLAACAVKPNKPVFGRPGRSSPASSTTHQNIPGPTPMPTSASSSSAPTTRRLTSARLCTRWAPTRRWCSAPRPTSSARTR